MSRFATSTSAWYLENKQIPFYPSLLQVKQTDLLSLSSCVVCCGPSTSWRFSSQVSPVYWFLFWFGDPNWTHCSSCSLMNAQLKEIIIFFDLLVMVYPSMGLAFIAGRVQSSVLCSWGSEEIFLWQSRSFTALWPLPWCFAPGRSLKQLTCTANWGVTLRFLEAVLCEENSIPKGYG